MISINLLPEAYRKAKTTSVEDAYRSPAVLGALGVLLVIGIAVALFGVSQQVRVAELNARMKELLPRKAILEQLLASIETIRQQQAVFKRVNQDRSQWAKQLNYLSDHTPDGMWFTDLSLEEEKGLTLHGSAIGGGGDEMVRIGRFVQSLKADAHFSSVIQDMQIESIKTSQDGDVEVVKFILTGKLAASVSAPSQKSGGPSAAVTGTKK